MCVSREGVGDEAADPVSVMMQRLVCTRQALDLTLCTPAVSPLCTLELPVFAGHFIRDVDKWKGNLMGLH